MKVYLLQWTQKDEDGISYFDTETFEEVYAKVEVAARVFQEKAIEIFDWLDDEELEEAIDIIEEENDLTMTISIDDYCVYLNTKELK